MPMSWEVHAARDARFPRPAGGRPRVMFVEWKCEERPSTPMIACVDVDYRETGAVAACVLCRDWTDGVPASEVLVHIVSVEAYVPGQFYRRELPCLLAVLEAAADRPDAVIIDGYVWLGDEGDPGLGAHLHEALGGRVTVIGVAKTRYHRARVVAEVRRGLSRSPLYVTAIGMDLPDAAHRIQEMHGPHRIPTLLKRVDQLCRSRAMDA